VRSIDVTRWPPCNAEPGRKHSNGERPAITPQFTEPQPANPRQWTSAGPRHSYQPIASFRLSLLFNLCAQAGKALPVLRACRRDMRWPPRHRRF